nr:unnamed protein product [Haemonchus contortus]
MVYDAYDVHLSLQRKKMQLWRSEQSSMSSATVGGGAMMVQINLVQLDPGLEKDTRGCFVQLFHRTNWS